MKLIKWAKRADIDKITREMMTCIKNNVEKMKQDIQKYLDAMNPMITKMSIIITNLDK